MELVAAIRALVSMHAPDSFRRPGAMPVGTGAHRSDGQSTAPRMQQRRIKSPLLRTDSAVYSVPADPSAVMAVICGMFSLLFIDAAIDRDVAIGNVAVPGRGGRRTRPPLQACASVGLIEAASVPARAIERRSSAVGDHPDHPFQPAGMTERNFREYP